MGVGSGEFVADGSVAEPGDAASVGVLPCSGDDPGTATTRLVGTRCSKSPVMVDGSVTLLLTLMLDGASGRSSTGLTGGGRAASVLFVLLAALGQVGQIRPTDRGDRYSPGGGSRTRAAPRIKVVPALVGTTQALIWLAQVPISRPGTWWIGASRARRRAGPEPLTLVAPVREGRTGPISALATTTPYTARICSHG